MRRWIVAAAVLLALAAALLALVEEKPAPVAAVEFPRAMRGREWQRMEARRGPPVVAVARADAAVPDEPARRRDPLLAALPARAEDPVIVFEANAVRHSRLGALFISCVLEREPGTFEDIERETGIDVLKDVDRIAFAGGAVVVSGFFDRARWDLLESKEHLVPSRYGDAATVWTEPSGEHPSAAEESAPWKVFASWKDQLVVFGSEEAVRRAIDQLEGRVAQEVALPDEMAYGEVYGVVPGAALRVLAGDGREELAARLAAAASRIEIHVDAMQDVAAVVEVHGEDPERMGDLARALGGALAVARVEARAKGDDHGAELLDHARVALGGESRFALEVAVPGDRLEAWFSRCAPAGR